MLSEDACICSENDDIVKYYYNSEQFIYILIYIYVMAKLRFQNPLFVFRN